MNLKRKTRKTNTPKQEGENRHQGPDMTFGLYGKKRDVQPAV